MQWNFIIVPPLTARKLAESIAGIESLLLEIFWGCREKRIKRRGGGFEIFVMNFVQKCPQNKAFEVKCPQIRIALIREYVEIHGELLLNSVVHHTYMYSIQFHRKF